MVGNQPRDMANSTSFTVSFRSNTTNEVFASNTISNVAIPPIYFEQLNSTLTPNASAPDANNKFVITLDGAANAGRTFYFNLVSVLPDTFEGYENGLRKDIAQAFDDIRPKFLRFPGGNNIEGYSVAQRWNWRTAIGPLSQRPGRVGDWNYYNTQGLGLMEYLEWTEAMNMERVLAVYSGFSLDVYGQVGTSFPPDQMQQWVQDALDEIEFCQGGPNTTYGALRAQYGHPEPFPINFVELGNEDFFSDTYDYRFYTLYNGINAVYPDITLISTAFNENPLHNITIPPGGAYDYHVYQEPQWFVENFDMWDNWQERTNNTNVTLLLGEYSAIQIDEPTDTVNYSFPTNEHIFYPRLLSAISEGLYQLSAERNPNVVKMTSYAPSLQNRNYVNWTPDLISFDAFYNNTVLSASYWSQWLFSHYRGTEFLPVTNPAGQINPLYWVATIDTDVNAIYLKVVNTLNQSVPLTVEFDAAFTAVNGTIIQADDLNSYNYIDNKTQVVPLPIAGLSAGNGSAGGYAGSSAFQWEVPKFSLSVLQFDL